MKQYCFSVKYIYFRRIQISVAYHEEDSVYSHRFIVGIGGSERQSASRPPNIILFLVDDMGWEDTSLPWIQKTHYNEVYETPNMERLAKGGMMFTQAYASSISSPTVAA